MSQMGFHFRRSARVPLWSGEPQRPDVRSNPDVYEFLHIDLCDRVNRKMFDDPELRIKCFEEQCGDAFGRMSFITGGKSFIRRERILSSASKREGNT